MDSMHVLAQRTIPALLEGSLALSARPGAPVLPARQQPTVRRSRLVRPGSTTAAPTRLLGRPVRRFGRRLAVGG